jgi:ribonuclease Z
MARLSGIEVSGISIAGLETCIDLPEWKLCFDLGRAQYFALARPTVLFTHPHMDHLGAIAWHCATRCMRGMRPPTYVVGREHAPALRRLFEVWRELDGSTMPHTLVELAPGEEFDLGFQRVVRPFRSYHRVPCQGYVVSERRQKLKSEFRALPGAEIARRRAAGDTALFELQETALLGFTGDSLIDVLEREEVLRRVQVLVLECSFVDERVSVAEARAMGHVHLDEIVERAELFGNQAVLLTHFSERYTSAEVVAALDAKLPPALRAKVTPLLAGRRD